MSRESAIFKCNVQNFWNKCHSHLKETDYAAEFNNHNYIFPIGGSFENFIAFGAKHSIISKNGKDAFELLKSHYEKHQDWFVGYLSYDLKNDIYNDLTSNNTDRKEFPDLCFFCPEVLIFPLVDGVKIESFENPEIVFDRINKTEEKQESNIINPNFIEDTDKSSYLKNVEDIRQLIYEGEFYEMNYCMEYYSEINEFNPLGLKENLWKASPTPFAAYFNFEDYHILSASPERFIKKTGSELLSQPIKGTIKTGTEKQEKELNRLELYQSEKERAENMMIVDLVRNDLARSSISGSVKVEELFGIYEFKHLYQMISSIKSEIKPQLHFVDAIKLAFPMGSMTGAPKKRVMEYIEEIESSKRGVFSGALGYIKANGDFDFNVLIRSLYYNKSKRNLSYSVGGAITFDSDPLKEFEETKLKSRTIREIFN